MKINWSIRFKKNATFIIRTVISLVIPILTYLGIKETDLTSWEMIVKLFESFITNPYLVFLTVVNFINLIPDPTTTGISDSDYAMAKESAKETPLKINDYGNGQEFTERNDK